MSEAFLRHNVVDNTLLSSLEYIVMLHKLLNIITKIVHEVQNIEKEKKET